MSVVERLEKEGVEGVRVGRFSSRVNTTCIVYRAGSTIIDTGPSNQWPIVQRFLEERRIERVLVTHHHEDHSGNGAAIRSQFRIPVSIHRLGASPLARGFKIQFYRHVVWGKPPRFVPELLPEEIELDGGMRLKAIHTPGHAEDLVCFLEPDRGWLFSGDLFIASKPRYLRADEDPNRQIESLRRVLTLDFQIVFCAHRGVVTEGRAAIQEKLDYLLALRDQAASLRREGRSLREVTRILLGKEDLMKWLSVGHFSKGNMIRALLAEDVSRGDATPLS